MVYAEQRAHLLDCGCEIQYRNWPAPFSLSFNFCPLHASAPRLLAALEAMAQDECVSADGKGDNLSGGATCPYCGCWNGTHTDTCAVVQAREAVKEANA